MGCFQAMGHACGQDAVQCTGHECEPQIDFDFQGYGEAEGVRMEEVNGIGERIFDQHSPHIVINEFCCGPFPVGW